jgi:hypothetical protein
VVIPGPTVQLEVFGVVGDVEALAFRLRKMPLLLLNLIASILMWPHMLETMVAS